MRRLRHRFERLTKTFRALVSHRHRYIPQESRIAGALDGACAENGAELVLRNLCKFCEIGREMAGRKSGLGGDRRAMIPGTHILADVAAENVVPHFCAGLVRNVTV